MMYYCNGHVLTYFLVHFPLVIRFTREEIMSRRKPSKVLPSMLDLHDILSIPPLDPVSFTTLDYDEVHRLWHVDKGTKSGGGGRGKGRIGKGTCNKLPQLF